MEDKHSMSLMLVIFKKNVRESFKKLMDKHKFIQVEKELYTDEENYLSRSNYINDYFNFYKLFNQMICLCFKSTENNYSLFLICYREVIVKLQTEFPQYNLSYLLPFYLDYILRNEITGGNSLNAVEEITDSLISIFPTLPDKDTFIDIHKNLVHLI